MAYRFPDDYMPRYDADRNKVVIPARPGVELEVVYLDESGQPPPDSVPERFHFIRLFLEEIARKRINSLAAARRLLADLTRASVMDTEGKYRGIYNAIQAVRVFLTTEDYYKYGEELKKLKRELDRIRGTIQNQDLGIARAEQARQDIAIREDG